MWKIYVEFVADIDIKILRVPLPRVGHAFLRQRLMRREGGLFIFAKFFSMYDAIHGWMDEKSFVKNDHDVLYYM